MNRILMFGLWLLTSVVVPIHAFAAPGASLPISYNLSTLTGNVRFIAPNGNDTSGNGSVSAPYATLAKAISVAANNDSIVIRGGTYRNQGDLTIPTNKSLKLIAYPGEIPIFNGARVVTGGWASEGSLSYISYAAQPITDGSGISFTSGQNLNGDFIGRSPDQVWIGATPLRQMSSKGSVVNGTFYVDAASSRLYMTATDAAKSGIEVSQLDDFMTVAGPNSSLIGFKVTRFSNSANDYGVIDFSATADGCLMQHMEMSDGAFQLINYNGGSSNLLNNCRMINVTLGPSNFMGTQTVFTDNFTMDAVKITNMNGFNEFRCSPQSGALKTSRTWYTKVINSEIKDNTCHGLWFDQSNYDVVVANNRFTGNLGSSVFFEISDKFLFINNFIHATTGVAVKLAGSSGLKLVNNTIIGGADPIGIYVDIRSKPGCSDPNQALCPVSYSSDRDTGRVHLNTLDWIPRLDLMINNVVAFPGGRGLCSTPTALCITNANGGTVVPLQSVIHQAEPARGIPRTKMNANVYANGTANVINTHIGTYTSISAFSAAMAGAPVAISGLEQDSLVGNSYVNADGSPTAALSSRHGNAEPVPTDAAMNAYIPAGTRRYGSLQFADSQPPPPPPPPLPIPPTPPPVFLVTLEAEAMKRTSGGISCSGTCVNLYANGSVYSKVTFPTTGDYTFKVTAKATMLSGTGAAMELRIDGVKVAGAMVNSTAMSVYNLSAKVAAGAHQVDIVFTNDATLNGVDRNLYVDKVVIAAAPAPVTIATLQAESMTTKTIGAADCDGTCWNLWSNGSVSQSVTFPAAGAYVFKIAARTSLYAGVGAKMDLTIDGAVVGSVTLTNTAMATMTLPANVAAGAHKVGVAFTNDGYGSATSDRNLYLDSVIISTP